MGEIARARAELLQLKEMEQDLLQNISHVRMEIEVYKSRIEHLARAESPINSLPLEILSYVLELVVPSTEYGDSRRSMSALTKVSRAWRDIILDSPKFWSNIHIDCSTTVSFVRTCVARCRQYPLDIKIKLGEANTHFATLIDDIIPHVCRWRTLEIYGNDRQCLQVVLHKLNSFKFPSLTCATITVSAIQMHCPTFLKPDSSPALTSLNLNCLIPTEGFLPGQRITNLSLAFSLDRLELVMLPSLLASQHLTTLELQYSCSSALQPDSISLPFLTSLTLRAQYPGNLISALLAPQLSYFSLTRPSTPFAPSLSTVFHGCESKFYNVRRFGLHYGADDSVSTVGCTISTMFPNARHVDLQTRDMNDFFRLSPDGSCPADNWELLESLTFREMKIRYESSPGPFVQWLRYWNSADLPMLRVKFVGCTFQSISYGSDYSTPEWLLRLHDLLREICILDMVDVVLEATAHVSLTSASPPLLVRDVIMTGSVVFLISHDLEIIRP